MISTRNDERTPKTQTTRSGLALRVWWNPLNRQTLLSDSDRSDGLMSRKSVHVQSRFLIEINQSITRRLRQLRRVETRDANCPHVFVDHRLDNQRVTIAAIAVRSAERYCRDLACRRQQSLGRPERTRQWPLQTGPTAYGTRSVPYRFDQSRGEPFIFWTHMRIRHGIGQNLYGLILCRTLLGCLKRPLAWRSGRPNDCCAAWQSRQ